jgi:membrane fusion protein (multidrug efflux system)
MAVAAPTPSASPAQPTAPAAPSAPVRRLPRRRRVKWIVFGVLLAAALLGGFVYWHNASRFASTEDAYVNAHQVEITAQVAGTVSAVHVVDQQKVKEGDPLFDIDRANYDIAFTRAQAELALARQQVSQQSAGVASAEALLLQRRAEAANARSNWERSRQLMASGFLSPQGAEQARTALATAQAAVRAAEANLAQAKSVLGATGDENAAVQAAAAAVKAAELDLQRTHVTAPTTGTIANFSLRPGNTVQVGVPLFVVISDHEYWVDANFKETQLEDIRPGQKAEIRSDMYPDHVFHGTVQSVSGGSGAAFSLLPPQNATGNWVKVTQRVPVRVKVDDPDPQHPLRIGTTATIKVLKSP